MNAPETRPSDVRPPHFSCKPVKRRLTLRTGNKELLQSLLKGVSIAPINKKTPTKASRPSKPNPTGEKRVKATVKAVKRTPSSGIRSSARQAGQKATDYGNDLLSDGEFGEEDSDGGFSDDDSEAEGTDEAEVGIGKKRKAKRPVQRKVKSLKGNRPDPKVRFITFLLRIAMNMCSGLWRAER